MLKSYMIGYDLNKSGKNYSGLTEKIKEISGTWWHHLDSTWIVKSEKSAVEIRDLLSPFIDADDELLVAGLSGDAAWKGFNSKGSEWIKKHL
ncbi:SinR family protein [Acinetobacter sp. WCHAc010034]|uniref:SinR family protein n=1 Tax=Acinetobacter sp. WCHAc010034 TaxID=1879049 RepID=UPI00083AD577|nr:SinR family protein [Acinetobacter sp. WCHAc010034]AYA02261.1 SinR family protein [Acinetobacter sp. WCHAc010034]